MAKKVRNFRATLDVTPDKLTTLPALLPDGYFIVGSETMQGVVRLVLEGASVTEDGHLQIVVTSDSNERRLSLTPQAKPPTNA